MKPHFNEFDGVALPGITKVQYGTLATRCIMVRGPSCPDGRVNDNRGRSIRAMKLVTGTAPVALLFFVWGCMNPPPPTPVQHPPASVSASFGRTWDAVVAIFADRNITIYTDRRAGMVSSALMGVPGEDSSWTSCGTAGVNERVMRPEGVKYTVTVKGDSTASTVHATALFGSTSGMLVAQCPSRGTWEAQFEAEAKSRAEQH